MQRSRSRIVSFAIGTGLSLVVAGASLGIVPAAVAQEVPLQVQSAKSAKGASGPKGNSIRVSQVLRLPAGGSFVTVTGRGFDPRVGIYVALCVQPRAGQKPSPCGGGADTDGSSRASAWVSSNAPSYGKGLATRYGKNGTFKVRIYVSPRLTSSIDCRTTRCAITTRADHTRINDRTWDLSVPVRFART